jgi:phosphate-selective porin OprO/OprP
LAGGQARAQEESIGQSFDQLSSRLDQQDQQIRQLQSQVNSMQQQGTPATPAAYAPGAAPAGTDPAAAKPAQGFEVGSDMSIKASFKNGTGLYFSTPNQDFTMHAGFWVQWDNVSWDQNSLNTTTGGIGTLNDGEYFRRIRPFVEGTFFETGEYRFNLALENNQFSTSGLDEFWVGMTKIPFLGSVRVGHVKDPMGLEGDMASSSRCMTFMERSAYSASIELNQNFVNGLWFGNSIWDDRFFYSGAVFRPDISGTNAGDYMGTGQWGWQTRITGLPIYENEGRQLLHLGLSGGWRDGTNSAGPGQPDLVSLSAGPEMKDCDPANNPAAPNSTTGGGTAQYLPNSNNGKLINTGNIICDQEYLLGSELLYIRGPWSFQAEYGWNFLNNAEVAGKAEENYAFNGGYLQVSYMLTGENRHYDKKFGTLSRYYLGGDGPIENAFLVRDADGNLCYGRGAWEIAARYSYVDLNAGMGTADPVRGGLLQGCSLALNWYMNTNLTVMTDWNYDFRYDSALGPDGSTNGLGVEVQLSF